MATPDPVAAAERWSTNLSGSTDKIRAGVRSVTEAPGAKAARNADAWLNGIIASKNKWATNVAAVSLSDWQTAMENKGITRISNGATEAKGKMADFFAEFFPFQDKITQQVRSMPNATLDQRIARAVAQIKGTHEFKRTRR